MGKIGIIANSRGIYETALQIARNYVDLVTIVTANDYKECVQCARELEESGAQVLLARGGYCSKIREADIPLPVVEIPTMADEIVKIILDAYKTCGNVAAIGSAVFIDFIKNYNFVIPVEIRCFLVKEWADFAVYAAAAKKMGYTAIIGGYDACRFGEVEGLRVFLNRAREQEMVMALNEALKFIRQLEQKNLQAQMLRTMLNSVHEGIIVVDPNGVITQINDVAVRYFSTSHPLKSGDLLSDKVLRQKVRGVLAGGEVVEDEFFSNDFYRFIYNMRPIQEDSSVTQVLIVLQESEYVHNAERKLRRNTPLNGMVATRHFYDILGESPAILEAIRKARQFSQFNSNVLIIGESGTGKEIFAQSIHNQSPRRNEAFVPVNCATIPPNLLESELFGYTEGAFTGARRGGKIGLFELAHNGTIFLDEISEMPLPLQARLLRVLEEHQIIRVGDSRLISVNIRVIAATNKDLRAMVEKGAFRKDLYYRLNVLALGLPPLRDRKSDIPVLVQSLMAQLAVNYHREPLTIEQDGMELLKLHEWPGNIRELKNIAERLVVMTGSSTIKKETIFSAFNGEIVPAQKPEKVSSNLLQGTEYELITKVMQETGGNKSTTARILGISRPTLLKKLKEMGIQ